MSPCQTLVRDGDFLPALLALLRDIRLCLGARPSRQAQLTSELHQHASRMASYLAKWSSDGGSA